MSSRKALSIIGFPWVAIVESKFSHRCKCGFATYRNYYYYCKYFPQFHLPLQECDDNVFEIAGFLGINTFPKPIFVTSVVFAQVVLQPAVVINYLQLWTSVTWVPWAPAWVDEWGDVGNKTPHADNEDGTPRKEWMTEELLNDRLPFHSFL